VSDGARERALLAHAFGLGFDLAGIARLGRADTRPHFDAWIATGFHGEMHYLERGAALRHDSTRPEPGMRSAIVVGMNYGGTQPSGPIARYALGDDYHRVLWDRLDTLGGLVRDMLGAAVKTRSYTDTGPILERDLARRAGLGWFGKNTMLINPTLGSFFLLGALFVDAELEPSAPFDEDRCGTCTNCLDACPTDAFRAPRVLDATRCVSYLTIELKGEIPEPLREGIGDRVFGCDVCQDVCPWNVKFARDAKEIALAPTRDRIAPDPRELLTLDEAGFKARFGTSAITRTKRRGLARNAAVALGNRRDPNDIPVLTRALDDPEPLVRSHAAWALAQIASREPAP
jgi:epoxyqueuosine reductase